MHMALHPKQGDVVVYCRGGEMRIYDRGDWELNKSNAAPIATLSASEGAALAWFLKYWLGDAALQPGYNLGGRVDADFDF
jgi:hypothetical protein